MTVDNFNLGLFILTAITVTITIYKMNMTLRSNIQENRIRILEIEKDVLEIKTQTTEDTKDLRRFIEHTFETVKIIDKKDHENISSKIEALSIKTERISTELSTYIKFNTKK